jgi:hypothetical protein
MFAAACAVLALGAAQAHEADWVYFPMYERDTAHAVHLPALNLRADGLLEAASRYPRLSEEEWTAAENSAGWYEYARRLIDCETGFSVELEAQLLDRASQPIASRPRAAAAWVEELTAQLRSASNRRWPDNSESALACIAASHPTLREERARRAAQPAPVVSSTPSIKALIAETPSLLRVANKYFDLDAVATAEPQTPEAVFEQLQQQYVDWRKSLNRSVVFAAPPEESLVRLRAKVAETLRAEGAPEMAFRLLAPDVVESLEDWQRLWETPPEPAKDAVVQATVLRTDCRSGLTVSLATVWLNERHEPLHTVAKPVAEVLAELRSRYPSDDSIQSPNLLSPDLASLRPCQSLAKLRHDVGLPLKAVDWSAITAEQLAAAKTPEAMLLLIRSAL